MFFALFALFSQFLSQLPETVLEMIVAILSLPFMLALFSETICRRLIRLLDAVARLSNRSSQSGKYRQSRKKASAQNEKVHRRENTPPPKA